MPQKGNKRKAMEELTRLKSTFEPPKAVQDLSSDMLFTDYLRQWLDIVKVRVKIATFSSYQDMTEGVIIPYFKKKGLRLREVEARHIQQFYSEKLKSVSANSVILSRNYLSSAEVCSENGHGDSECCHDG